MVEEGMSTAYFRHVLSRIDAEDEAMVAELSRLSTVDPAHRFITLEDASQGIFMEEEKRNFFFFSVMATVTFPRGHDLSRSGHPG